MLGSVAGAGGIHLLRGRPRGRQQRRDQHEPNFAIYAYSQYPRAAEEDNPRFMKRLIAGLATTVLVSGGVAGGGGDERRYRPGRHRRRPLFDKIGVLQRARDTLVPRRLRVARFSGYWVGLERLPRVPRGVSSRVFRRLP